MAAGVFQGSLALLLAREQKYHEAQTLVEQAEARIQAYPEEYGKFLCKKAELLLLNSQKELAIQTLEQAQSIAQELQLPQHSDLLSAISALWCRFEGQMHNKNPA